MKSLASLEVSLNSSSSKPHLQLKILFRVSLSSSPRKGHRPLRLHGRGRKPLACVSVTESVYCVCMCAYSQHVGNDSQAPHVCVERHKVVVDYLRSKKLGSAEIHSQLLPWFISTWGHHLRFCIASVAYFIKNKSKCVSDVKYQHLHSGETKVDNLDLICGSAHTKNVLWLELMTNKPI